jgi:hypothetical protein
MPPLGSEGPTGQLLQWGVEKKKPSASFGCERVNRYCLECMERVIRFRSCCVHGAGHPLSSRVLRYRLGCVHLHFFCVELFYFDLHLFFQCSAILCGPLWFSDSPENTQLILLKLSGLSTLILVI